MYYPYFITYMIAGFVVSLVVFCWALKNGQFTDQQRARFLPLEDEPKAPGERISRFSRFESYLVLFLAGAGLMATIVVLLLALFARPGQG